MYTIRFADGSGEVIENTLPSTKLTPLGAEVEKQFYGHGGFMGAAPQLWRDEWWTTTLKSLMQKEYEVIKPLADKGDWKTVIGMMENNPVMAAYGMWKTKEKDELAPPPYGQADEKTSRMGRIKAMEWDVFLPPIIVMRLGNIKLGVTPEQIEKTEDDLVDGMVIAHGSKEDLQTESGVPVVGKPVQGVSAYFNVRWWAEAGKGGKMTADWMRIFGAALRLVSGSQEEEKLVDNLSEIRQTVDVFKRQMNKKFFSVILDIKTETGVTSAVIAGLIRGLNRKGIHVYGVGSFQFHHLRDLADRVGDQQVKGSGGGGRVMEIRFYHIVEDVINACKDSADAVIKPKPGDTVMFNVGSLLGFHAGGHKEANYEIDSAKVEALKEAKGRIEFDIGVYIQEPDLHRAAIRKIIEHVNANKDLYNLGFAWGGLSYLESEPGLVRGLAAGHGRGLGAQNLIPERFKTQRPLNAPRRA